jgi:prepilin-type N-terminal cleavage/methylation domain-containing protein
MVRLIRKLRSESGVTLVEMAVVVALLGIVAAFVLQSVASYERAATGGIRRLENLDEARVLMAVMTKDIRTAAKLDASGAPFVPSADPDVALADDNEITFYANLNMTTSCPKVIHLFVNAKKELIEDVTEPATGSTTPPNCSYDYDDPSLTRTRLVGQYVANDLTDPAHALFTYYYDDGSGSLVQFTNQDPDLTPLSESNALLVEAIGINLEVRKSTALPVAVTTLVNRVRLPNVFYNPPPSPSP